MSVRKYRSRPSKFVFGEHLTGFREARGGKRLDQLLEALRGTEDLQWIDSRPALLAAKTNFEGRDLYFRTDTHWNGLGAFVAYESLMAGLEPTLNLPRLENLDPARYEIRISPFSGGDLSANMLNAQWRFRDSKIELVPRFPLFAVDVATAEIVASAGVAIPDLSGWANRAAVKTMVVYGDSFAKHVILYLREHFSRGYFIPEHVIDGEAVGKLRPDVVILEIVERNLASLLDKPKNLDKACRS